MWRYARAEPGSGVASGPWTSRLLLRRPPDARRVLSGRRTGLPRVPPAPGAVAVGPRRGRAPRRRRRAGAHGAAGRPLRRRRPRATEVLLVRPAPGSPGPAGIRRAHAVLRGVGCSAGLSVPVRARAHLAGRRRRPPPLPRRPSARGHPALHPAAEVDLPSPRRRRSPRPRHRQGQADRRPEPRRDGIPQRPPCPCSARHGRCPDRAPAVAVGAATARPLPRGAARRHPGRRPVLARPHRGDGAAGHAPPRAPGARGPRTAPATEHR